MNIIDRVKNILITPKTEWNVIEGETTSLSTMLTTYVFPLLLIGAISAFVGFGLIGYNTGLLGIRIKGIDWGLYEAITRLVAGLLGFVISAYVVDMLAANFKSEKNINKSAQLVGYSATASFVGGIFLLIPALAIVAILCGLYGIYLMYLGIGPLKKTPEDQKVIYMLVSIIVYAVITWLLIYILHMILGSIFNIGLASLSLS